MPHSYSRLAPLCCAVLMNLFARSASAKPLVKVVSHFDPKAAWIQDVIAARLEGSDPKRYIETHVTEALNVTFPVFTFKPDGKMKADKTIHVVLRPSSSGQLSALPERQVQLKLCFGQPVESNSHTDCTLGSEWVPVGVTASESEKIVENHIFREKLKHAAQRDQQGFLAMLRLPLELDLESRVARGGQIRTNITYQESGAVYSAGMFFKFITRGIAYRFQACFPVFIGGTATTELVNEECGFKLPDWATLAPSGSAVQEIFYIGTLNRKDLQ